jgi:hypothetical protein
MLLRLAGFKRLLSERLRARRATLKRAAIYWRVMPVTPPQHWDRHNGAGLHGFGNKFDASSF